MWRNYLTVSLRTIVKNRTFAFINIFGLAIGIAAFLMLVLFVRYETSYDKWIPGSSNVFQLQTWFTSAGTGSEDAPVQLSAYVTGERLKKDFPQVESTVYALWSDPVFLQDGQASTTENYRYVNGNFLDVVPLPLLRGDARALDHVGTAVLTKAEALRRFGTDDAVGRHFTVISKGQQRDFTVGAVIRDVPRNSHLAIAALIRIDFASFFADEPRFLSCWDCQAGWTYVKLKPNADVQAIQSQLPAWERRNIPDAAGGDTRTSVRDTQDWRLVNIADVHLGRAQTGAMSPGNDRKTILTFAAIATLILMMAVVNFTNLATAGASQRAREVALRKVFGAKRKQLIGQFLAESLLVAAVATLIALAVVELLVGPFAAFLEADISLSYFGSGGIAVPAILVVAGVGLLGGLYPAFVLSRFRPAAVLKGNRSSRSSGSTLLRSALVVGQFAVCIGLIICTAVIYSQTVYARSVDPGYKRDHILQVEELGRSQLADKGAAIVRQVERVPGVESVGRTTIGVATGTENSVDVMVPGAARPVSIGSYAVDQGFFGAMGLRIVTGRWFDENRPLDDASRPVPSNPDADRALVSRGANVVINELAARRLGFQDPARALGRTVKAALVGDDYGSVPVTIIGVVKDARFRSVKLPVEPLLFMKTSNGHTHMIVRYRGDPAAVRAGVERVWKSFTNEIPFKSGFSEDIVRNLYKGEEARAKTFAFLTLLSLTIGCLGIFGLAVFEGQRRTKEIGIRKVLGARVRDIVQLLLAEFSRYVLLANLIAWPAAWWVMRDWLNGFDARITLGPVPFIAAGLLTLAVGLGTIAGHAVRVARANPIDALRYE